MTPRLSLILLSISVGARAGQGWDSDMNLAAMAEAEVAALCSYSYSLRGGAPITTTCASDAGDYEVTLEEESLEVGRCLGAERPPCKASLFEACAQAMGEDPCGGGDSDACLGLSICAYPE